MQNQAEYRENAMRDRHQTGDWFNHNSSGSSPSGSAAGLRSSPVKKLSQESEAWFDYSPTSRKNGASPSSAIVGAAKLDKNQNWFRHEDAAGATGSPRRDLYPIGVSVPKVKPRRSSDEKLAREAAAGDPNSWFRHDHVADASPTSERLVTTSGSSGSKKRIPAKAGQEPLWFAQNGREQNGGSGDVTPTSKTRHSGPDADLYYQRDKTGSGAEWFPHLHAPSNGGADDQHDAALAAPVSSRGGNNRMNAESPAWFSHDNPPAAQSPRPAASSEVRKMQARASGDEIRQILRVNDNLNEQQHQQQQQESSTDESKHRDSASRVSAATVSQHQVSSDHGDAGVVERGTDGLVEKFQREVALTDE